MIEQIGIESGNYSGWLHCKFTVFIVIPRMEQPESLGYKFMIVQTFTENEEVNAFYRVCGAKLDKSNVYYFRQKLMEAL